MRIEVKAKGSRRYEYRTGTGLSGWRMANSTFTILTIKAEPKSTCTMKITQIGSTGEKERTNELEGQDLNTFVGPFQRLVEVNGDSPQESQNKPSR